MQAKQIREVTFCCETLKDMTRGYSGDKRTSECIRINWELKKVEFEADDFGQSVNYVEILYCPFCGAKIIVEEEVR